MRRFAALSEEERQDARNDGDIRNYEPKNQAIREALYEDDMVINKLLDKWWRACQIYFDKDSSDTLTSDEYAAFHERLIALVSQEGDLDDLTEEEKAKMFKDDFRADSGIDGSIDKEEFRYAIFELAE